MHDDETQVHVSKTKKAIAVTKATLIVLCFFGLLAFLSSVFVILDRQDETANYILECTAPWGGCYQEKAEQLIRDQQTEIGATVEYCATINNQSVAAIRECVEKELLK